MASQYWQRRWISRREINDRKKWASAWRSNPERMRLAQSKATRAAQISRARSRDNLLAKVRQEISKEPMPAFQLKAAFRDFLKSNRKPHSPKSIKALTVRLTRYGALRYDPASALWTIVH